METTESTTRIYSQARTGAPTTYNNPAPTAYPQGTTYPSSTGIPPAPSTAATATAYPSTAVPISSSSYGSSPYDKGASYPSSQQAAYPSSGAYASEKVGGSSYPSDKNASAYAQPSSAYNQGQVQGQPPVAYNQQPMVSGVQLRPGVVFPAGDIPHSTTTESIFDISMVLLLLAGLVAVAAASDWSIDITGRHGWYFGSACMAAFGFAVWVLVFWLGWRYARESVTLPHGLRFLWLGMLIGGATAAVEWGAVIKPLRFQYERWHLDGSRFDQKQTTHILLVKALGLAFMDQGLILIFLFWATARRSHRLWRPYSYLVVALNLEIGCWLAEQVLVYSVFPAWTTATGGFQTNGEVARGLFGEALFFMLCASPFFIVAGLLAGASRAIHQLNDKDQIEMAHVADLPPELFPGPLAASVLLLMMVVLRGFFEVFHIAVLVQGGQGIAATKTSIVLVYLLIGIIGYALLRHRIRATFPVMFALDPQDNVYRHRASTVGVRV